MNISETEKRISEMYDAQEKLFSEEEVLPRELQEMQLHWLGNIAAILVGIQRQLDEIAKRTD